jgi:hypothetical protein
MKLTALLMVLSCSLYAQGQTAEGNHSVGGSISFSSTHSGSHTSTFLNFAPEGSLFVLDNFEVGTSVSVQSTFDGGTNIVWGIGPFVNWYLSEDPVKPLVGARYTFSYFSFSNSGDSGSMFTVQGGVLVPLNQKVAVVPLLQMNLYSGPQSTYQFLIGVSLKAFL